MPDRPEARNSAMTRLRVILTVLALAVASPVQPWAVVQAETQAPAGDPALQLSQTLRLADLIGVMRDEGLDYAETLEADLFPGQGGAAWRDRVALVYDAPAMLRRFDARFAREMADDPAAVTATQAFFGDARGQRILTLEIEARRALMDKAVEDAAKARAEEMAADQDPRMAALRRFAVANDLIESNVMGALNANLAFYQGMAEIGAFGDEMTEEQMLADVWGQEAEVRTETEDWLYPFLALAYGPLSDGDLEAYTEFSQTPAGKKLNVALFAAFDEVFVQVSRDLGRAAAQQMQGQDI